MIKPRNAYSLLRVQTEVTGPSRTKQSMKAECDINNILRKYQKTGNISHFAKHAGYYDYAPAVDYMEALDIVAKAQQMFRELPAETRREFRDDPAAFLDFVQDPDNLPRMRELGLANPLPTPPKESAPPPDPATPGGG